MTENAAARAEVLRTRDLVGWTVTDPSGTSVGTVSDLLIGRDGRVRYLAVKRGLMSGSVLVPVDELDWGEHSMRLSRWADADVRRLPPYDADRPLTPEVLEEMERAHPRFYGGPLNFDAAGVEEQGKIVPLRDAREFRVPKDAPNPRGWNVFGEDNERVGVVEGLLVDPSEMRVRYLDVDVSDDLFLLREDRHVAIPMEYVELRERGEDVWIKGLTARQIARLPAYTGGALDPLVAQRVEQAFHRPADPDALPPAHRASPPHDDVQAPAPHDDEATAQLPPPSDSGSAGPANGEYGQDEPPRPAPSH